LGAILFCLAAFGAPVIRILAAAVGSEIILGADKGPGVFDNPFDLCVQFCRLDRLSHELMHAGIPRLLVGAWLGMGGEHNDGNITVGAGVVVANHFDEFYAVQGLHSKVANDDIGVEIIKFPESLIDRIHRRRILGPREDRIVDIR